MTAPKEKLPFRSMTFSASGQLVEKREDICDPKSVGLAGPNEEGDYILVFEIPAVPGKNLGKNGRALNMSKVTKTKDKKHIQLELPISKESLATILYLLTTIEEPLPETTLIS